MSVPPKLGPALPIFIPSAAGGLTGRKVQWCNVALYVADMTGRKVLDITNGESMTSGKHSFLIGTENLSNGVYYVVVKSGQFTQTKKS